MVRTMPAPPAVPQASVNITAFGNWSTAQLRAMAAPWKLNASRAAAIGTPHLAGKYAVCISPYTPDVFCSPDQPTSEYAGYLLKVFEEVAKRTDWLRDFSSWDYRCTNWSVMVEDTIKPRNPDCALSLGLNPSPDGKFRVSRAINQQGLLILTRMANHDDRGLFSPLNAFTWQLWLLLFGSAIVIGAVLWLFDLMAGTIEAAKKAKEDAQAENDIRGGDSDDHEEGVEVCLHCGTRRTLPADVEAALAAAVGAQEAQNGTTAKTAEMKTTTSTVTSVNAKSVNSGNGKDDGKGKDKDKNKDEKPKPTRPPRRWLAALGVKHEDEDKVLKQLNNNLRTSLLHLSRTSKPPFSNRLPAQVVLWALGFTVMITISIYTGTTAAMLTTSSLTGSIHSRADLIGKAVGTWEDYTHRLDADGLTVTSYKWDTPADEHKMVDDLRKGRLAALVLDASFVRYVDGHNCDLVAVGQEFLVNDIGIGFSTGMPMPLIDDVNLVIISVIDDGTMEVQYNIHVNNLGGPCSITHQLSWHSRGPPAKGSVRIGNVAGLWCILLIAILAGFVLLGFSWLKVRRAAAKELAVRAARSVSRSVRSVGRIVSHTQPSKRLSRDSFST